MFSYKIVMEYRTGKGGKQSAAPGSNRGESSLATGQSLSCDDGDGVLDVCHPFLKKSLNRLFTCLTGMLISGTRPVS
jgi:hypothetical protein